MSKFAVVALVLAVFADGFAAEPQIHGDLAYTKPADEVRRLDVYAPADGSDQPVLVWIHVAVGGRATNRTSNRSQRRSWTKVSYSCRSTTDSCRR
jgi:hypothetical protein